MDSDLLLFFFLKLLARSCVSLIWNRKIKIRRRLISTPNNNSVTGKFKLSQNRNEEDYATLKKHLAQREDPTLKYMAWKYSSLAIRRLFRWIHSWSFLSPFSFAIFLDSFLYFSYLDKAEGTNRKNSVVHIFAMVVCYPPSSLLSLLLLLLLLLASLFFSFLFLSPFSFLLFDSPTELNFRFFQMVGWAPHVILLLRFCRIAFTMEKTILVFLSHFKEGREERRITFRLLHSDWSPINPRIRCTEVPIQWRHRYT